MYYPYLRGKQFELKALREFAAENCHEGRIIPIIEPVNKSISAMEAAVGQFVENNFKFAMILNPSDGDFRYPEVRFELPENPLMTENMKAWIPTYLYQGDPVRLNTQIAESVYDNVMIVFRKCVDVDNVDVMTLLSNSKVRWIVNDFGNMVMRRTKHALLEIGKDVIILEDCFKTRKRNTDYSDSVDEPFSEMFYYYRDEEFSGFSDYTALSSEFIDGGMLPYAIAIHLTYERAKDQIYIHHFVSDTNYDQSNVRLKFAEAARKIEPFFRDKARTSAVSELIDRADASDGYPGLGYLKKLSVKNHLELVSRIMR